MAAQEDLVLRLRQEREILRNLLSLTGEQRDCLIGGASDRLGEIVNTQAVLLQKLSHIAAKTTAALDAAKTSIPESVVVPAQLRQEIAQLAAEVRRQAQTNGRLAQQAMEYTDFCIGLFRGRAEQPVYSHTGTRDATAARSLMNQIA
jgi:flagellar biosynthesis/type III secretory pathway chaperone